MSDARGDEPYFLDEPRRYEEEQIASGHKALAELRRINSNSAESSRYWDEIFKDAARAANERC